jgi:hypothetical protein
MTQQVVTKPEENMSNEAPKSGSPLKIPTWCSDMSVDQFVA